MTSDEEDREMRHDFGRLWAVGCLLALCEMATLITVLQRIARKVRR